MAHTREHMLGLTTRPERYLRLTRIPFRGIHARLVADVMAANLAPGSRVLDIGTGPGTLPIEIARAAWNSERLDRLIPFLAQRAGRRRAAVVVSGDRSVHRNCDDAREQQRVE